MKWLKICSDFVNKIVITLLFPLLLVMFLVVLIAVIFRLVNINFISSYDLSRLLFVWMTFMGMTVIYKKRGHMKFSFLYDKFTGTRKIVVDTLIDLLVLAFFLIVTIASFKLLPRIQVQKLPGSGIPSMWLYLPFFVTPCIMVIHSVAYLCENLQILISQRGK